MTFNDRYFSDFDDEEYETGNPEHKIYTPLIQDLDIDLPEFKVLMSTKCTCQDCGYVTTTNEYEDVKNVGDFIDIGMDDSYTYEDFYKGLAYELTGICVCPKCGSRNISRCLHVGPYKESKNVK